MGDVLTIVGIWVGAAGIVGLLAGLAIAVLDGTDDTRGR